MDKHQLSTPEVKAELKRVADELKLLRNSRSQLAGKRDPISVRNVKHMSIKIRDHTSLHESLRQILINRGEIDK